jgi:hypothetical protein
LHDDPTGKIVGGKLKRICGYEERKIKIRLVG